MNSDIESVLISSDELESIVNKLAEKINEDYKDEELLLVVILKGSVVFAVDLMRKLKMPVTMDFMQVSSYGAWTKSSNVIDVKLDLKTDIEGKNVLILEDIIDSGNTLAHLYKMLSERKPKLLRICTLLDKPERREANIEPAYVGKVIPDEFIVGYGLDYAENFRNLPYIGVLSRKAYE